MAVVETNGQDPTMGIDNFGEVKVLSRTETVCRNLLLILFGKPGFYPANPDLGLDISQYIYKFDNIDVDKLRAQLEYQCSTLVPEIDSLDFDVKVVPYKGQGMLVIQFPIIRNDDRLSMVLGVTTNNRGEFMYRFVENRTQII